MPAVKIQGFDGIIPRQAATALGDNQAQQADNVKLYSRELRYWRGPTLENTPVLTNAQTIYKHYAGPDTYWLAWSGDVDVAESPTADFTDYRLYYTGDGVPKKTNATLIAATTGQYPRTWRNMGVPAPTGAPSVTPAAGTGTVEARAYVYTYVSTFGAITEESAPSPATIAASVYVTTGATIGGFTAAPTTNYNITAIRIYRSVAGTQTDNYLFVAEIPIATASYSDTLTAAQLGTALATIGWSTPPTGLKGLVALPSGSLAGFDGNVVYFSEPYFPHAWPLKYALNIPSKIVGLGVFGSSVVVMTDRWPHIINGGTPGAMSVERVPLLEPCVSKKSIAASTEGVMYASPNGLVALGYNTRAVTTNNLFRRDEWQDYSPAAIRATTYDNRYVAIQATGEFSSFVLSADDIPALSRIDINSSAVHVDNRAGQLFYVSTVDSKIYRADADDLNPLPFTWKSKRFVMPRPTTFSALRLDADFGQADTAAAYQALIAQYQARNAALFASDTLGALNSTVLNYSYNDTDPIFAAFPYRGVMVNGSALVDVPPDAASRSVQVLLYGDGKLQATLDVTSFNTIRIPPFKSKDLEVLLRGSINVRAITLATTVQEVLV